MEDYEKVNFMKNKNTKKKAINGFEKIKTGP